MAAGTNPGMTLTPADLGNTTQDWIGRSQYPADPYLDGSVNDFQIYSSALTAAQVAALASGQPGAGNVADYKFDETGGATATDSSGQGNNGTIISNPASPPTMDAYEVILSPGGTGSPTPSDSTWLHSYLASQATLTGLGLEHQHRRDTQQPGRVRHRRASRTWAACGPGPAPSSPSA